jgi:hypothetical protein
MRLGLPSYLFFQGFLPKHCKHVLVTHACYMPRSSDPWFDHSHNIWRGEQIIVISTSTSFLPCQVHIFSSATCSKKKSAPFIRLWIAYLQMLKGVPLLCPFCVLERLCRQVCSPLFVHRGNVIVFGPPPKLRSNLIFEGKRWGQDKHQTDCRSSTKTKDDSYRSRARWVSGKAQKQKQETVGMGSPKKLQPFTQREERGLGLPENQVTTIFGHERNFNKICFWHFFHFSRLVYLSIQFESLPGH